MRAGWPQDIPGLLPDIMQRVRLIWNVSAFYGTPERVTGLLRRVSNSIINICSGGISVRDALSGNPEAVVAAVQVSRGTPSQCLLYPAHAHLQCTNAHFRSCRHCCLLKHRRMPSSWACTTCV